MSDPTPRQSSRLVGGRPRRYIVVEPPPPVLLMLEAVAAEEGVSVLELTEVAIRSALFDLLASRGMPTIVNDSTPWPTR